MSGWTIITLRGKPSKDYPYSEYNEHDPWQATADIVATMEEDDRVRKWTTWNGHVYAYLKCQRYDFKFAEEFMEDYGEMAKDAVVLGANDTTDTGKAKYYRRADLAEPTDCYEETQKEDGTLVGELALCVINSRHGIIARDPFHNNCDQYDTDEHYLDSGNSKIDSLSKQVSEQGEASQ